MGHFWHPLLRLIIFLTSAYMMDTARMHTEVMALYAELRYKEAAINDIQQKWRPPAAFQPMDYKETEELAQLEVALPFIYATFDPVFNPNTATFESPTEQPPGRRFYRPSTLVKVMEDGRLMTDLFFAPLRRCTLIRMTAPMELQYRYKPPYSIPKSRYTTPEPAPVLYRWGWLAQDNPTAGGVLWHDVAYVWDEPLVTCGSGIPVTQLITTATPPNAATNMRVFLLNPLTQLTADATC
jgi:hypothetical protein